MKDLREMLQIAGLYNPSLQVEHSISASKKEDDESFLKKIREKVKLSSVKQIKNAKQRERDKCK